MDSQSRHETHAIVLGASMAGLVTARALSTHFDQVTILERDPVLEEPHSRKGQPQTRHLHGLLASGLQILTHYYPDLPTALEDGGAILPDFGTSMRWYTGGGYRKRFRMGVRAALMSRPFLEHLVRQRTLARPNVSLWDQHAVRGLCLTEDGRQVTGVAFDARQSGRAAQTLSADLVVDCTGRGSRSPQWLAAAGYAAPAESVVTINVGYATQILRRDPADPRGKEWILITPEAPRESRFGGLFPIEGERWIVSMGGWIGDHAPTDPSGFLAYARALPAPDIYNIMCQAEPISDVIPHKFSASLRRHYEKLSRFPDRFLVLGDAVCSFNPTYGQGMTSAAMQAAALDELLTERQGRLAGLAPVFFQRASKVIDIPWQLAVGEDFRFPQTTGPKPAGVDLLNRYVTMVHRATLYDAEVGRAFARVMNLLAPPTSLMRPRVLARVLRANWLPQRGATHAAESARLSVNVP